MIILFNPKACGPRARRFPLSLLHLGAMLPDDDYVIVDGNVDRAPIATITRLVRERGDVELLATHLWAKVSQGNLPFPTELLARWQSYKWPGNVRELYNAVQRWYSLGQTEVWDDGADRPEPLGQGNDLFDTLLHETVPYTIARRRVLDEFDRRFVTVALERTSGSVAKAAATYGIARRYFTKIKSKSR